MGVINFTRLVGRVFSLLDLRSVGRRLKCRQPRCRVQSCVSCLQACASVTKQYLFRSSVSWEGIHGLASHWPCVTNTIHLQTQQF